MPPTRAEMIGVFDEVLAGRMTRKEASQWAMQWVALADPSVDDPTVWEALTLLGMIDLDHGDEDRTHLYPVEQIVEWRNALT